MDRNTNQRWYCSNKSFSKSGQPNCKKYPKQTKGTYIIDSEEKRIKALKWLKLEDVWGIGRQHSKRLNAMGVKNAFDFTQLDDEWVRKQMAIVGLRLKYDLQGIPTLDLEATQIKKNIATTRSFEKNYTEYNQLAERICTFAASCAEKLRKQNSCCNSLMVFIHTNGHRKELPQYSRNIVLNYPFQQIRALNWQNLQHKHCDIFLKQGMHTKKQVL